MKFSLWQKWFHRKAKRSNGGRRHARPQPSFRPRLEALEDRLTPDAGQALLVEAPPTNIFGEPIDIHVILQGHPASGHIVRPGQMTFLVDGTVEGTAPVSADFWVADFTLTTVPVGSHQVTAQYSGDLFYPPNEGSTMIQVVSAQFVVSAPGSVTANTPFSFTVTVRDQFGNTVKDYWGTVHFSSSDRSAMLPADSMLTGGTGTVRATLQTFGVQTLTVTDTANSSLTGTTTIQSTRSNAGFVQQLYLDLLDRAADADGLTFWSTVLDRGISARSQVALAIENSAEYRIDVIANFYQTLLGRAGDPTGFASWMNFLNNGGLVQQLKGTILASPEYVQLHGGTNCGFLSAVYQDIFGRAIDPGAAQACGLFLANDGSRQELVYGLQGSQEGLIGLVQSHYLKFLHRVGELASVSFWVALEQQPLPDELIVAGILGSPEYLSVA
jgi:hypothetical protein